MIVGHLHVKCRARVTQVFGNQHSTLLTNQQRSAIGVATHIIRTDGQIGNLQALDTVDVEAFVQDTVLDDGVSFLGGHGTGAQTVPSGFHMALGPFNDMVDVLVCVRQVFADLLLVAVEEGRGRCGAGLQRHTPASVLDAGRDVVFARVGLCGCQVHVHGARGAVVGVEGVHGGHFAGVGVHASSRFARLDVAPYHWRHVSLVVHEPGIKVGSVVGAWRSDVGEASAEGVLQEVEHGEEFPGRHQHVVAEPACDDAVMHDWFLRRGQHCKESVQG